MCAVDKFPLIKLQRFVFNLVIAEGDNQKFNDNDYCSGLTFCRTSLDTWIGSCNWQVGMPISLSPHQGCFKVGWTLDIFTIVAKFDFTLNSFNFHGKIPMEMSSFLLDTTKAQGQGL